MCCKFCSTTLVCCPAAREWLAHGRYGTCYRSDAVCSGIGCQCARIGVRRYPKGRFHTARLIYSAAGWVHGDLRLANLFVRQGRGFILDFDWAGRADADVYPRFLNPGNSWMDGVASGGIMRKEHDLFLLDKHLARSSVDAGDDQDDELPPLPPPDQQTHVEEVE